MSKNLLNYEGLEYFLSKLLTYIENQRTVKNVDTTASNGINLSNTNGTLDVTVTPGSVANGDTGLVTGDAVYDAIQAGKAIEVQLTASGTANQYTTNIHASEVVNALNSGKDAYIIIGFNYTGYVFKAQSGMFYSGSTDVCYCNTTTDYNLNIILRVILHSGTLATLFTYTLAKLDSPLFTGTPTAPTADLGTNTTQIATTAFVTQTVANALIGKAAFQGTVDSLSDIPVVYKKGYHWLVLTAGTYFTHVCEVGDIIYCVADSDAEHESSWSIENDFTVILNNLDITIISNAEIDSLFTTESSDDSSNNG